MGARSVSSAHSSTNVKNMFVMWLADSSWFYTQHSSFEPDAMHNMPLGTTAVRGKAEPPLLSFVCADRMAE